jgi:2-ketoarginine methyltransferase
MKNEKGFSFEKNLIKNIQPIRNYVLAISIYNLFESGLYDVLLKGKGVKISELVCKYNFDEKRVCGFIKYLCNEKIVKISKEVVALTAEGKAFNEIKPWYTMLVGGYGETFLQMKEKLKTNTGWASRDILQVGIGSCGISHFDSIPLTKMLMKKIPKPCHNLLDLGCGNGLYLVEFCKSLAQIKKAVGVEPSKEACKEALQLIKNEKLGDRIDIICSSAIKTLAAKIKFNPDLVVLGFVLHEILAQEGEKNAICFLKQVIASFPDIYIIVIEVNDQITNSEVMKHKLAQAYYNPYYLLHYFTNQQLMPESYWDSFFKKCGLEIVSKGSPQANIDSTGLEIGYLLRKKNGL